MLLKNSSNASSPPADAPNPTTGNRSLPISRDLLPAFFLGFVFWLAAVFLDAVRLLDFVFALELFLRELPGDLFLLGDDFLLAKCDPLSFVHHADSPDISSSLRCVDANAKR